MSRIVALLTSSLADVERRTGTRPQVAHIGRDLWVELCAASGTGLLPSGTFIELDGCIFEFRDTAPPTGVYFEPADVTRAREQTAGSPHGQAFGWAGQLEKHKWKNVGPDRWSRDGKPALSTGEAIEVEKREAASREAIKGRMAHLYGDAGPSHGTQKDEADRILREHGIRPPS